MHIYASYEGMQMDMKVRLTELRISLDPCYVLTALNRLSKDGELGFFIRPDEATKDRAP